MGSLNPFASAFFLVENGSQFQAKARLEAALRCPRWVLQGGLLVACFFRWPSNIQGDWEPFCTICWFSKKTRQIIVFFLFSGIFFSVCDVFFFSKKLADLLGAKNILPRKWTNPWSSWASWDDFCCIPLNQLGHLPLKNPWNFRRHDLWVGRRADAELRESVEGMTAQVQDFFFSRVLILGWVMSPGNPNILSEKNTRWTLYPRTLTTNIWNITIFDTFIKYIYESSSIWSLQSHWKWGWFEVNSNGFFLGFQEFCECQWCPSCFESTQIWSSEFLFFFHGSNRDFFSWEFRSWDSWWFQFLYYFHH